MGTRGARSLALFWKNRKIGFIRGTSRTKLPSKAICSRFLYGLSFSGACLDERAKSFTLGRCPRAFTMVTRTHKNNIVN